MPRYLTPQESARLTHVPPPPGNLDLACFPDFMVVGPQRTGSTWLHRNLGNHSQVFVTDPKEIYYFSSVQWPDRHPPQLPPIETELGWYLRFFEVPESRSERIKVRGEATASYAVSVSDDVIDDMLVLNPDLKVLLLVRNPVERGWSHVKKDLCLDTGLPVEDVTIVEVERFFESPYHHACGLFSEIITRWRSKLGADNLFIGDFRDIERRPDELLRKVFDFLGVDRNVDTGDVKTRKIASTPEGAMPAGIRAFFDELYADELKALAAMGYTWN